MNRMQERYEALFDLCQKFIRENRISCPETIYQMDHVIEHACEFIHDVCEIVGYAPSEEDEEDD